MTAMVQTELGPPPVPKYKDESAPVADDHRNPKPIHQAPPPQNIQQHPRSAGLVQQQRQRPESPHQPTTSVPPGTYTPPHALGNGIPLQHQSPYGPPPPQEQTYYTSHPSPYNPTSTPGQYPSTEAPDLMAATAQMQRPYPPIYHTPQSNSPASVASPQTHDQHGRSLYTQPPPQMPQGMYGYPQYPPMNPVHHSPYTPHPGAQQQHTQLTSQPLLVSSAAQMQHQQPQTHPAPMNSSPRMKMDPNQQQPTPPQRAAMNPAHPTAPVQNSHSSSSSGANPNAAPGPIPATTPLVVRQDSSGVQWIAFEYSRDRVKLEYTIRCDVESVNVEHLSTDFKTENCVYPRACCSKDQYRGNRLVYETECNAVGWALAELNPCLRGKRGLIQRAVDSWRNSNQDPRLRSRRVRRMAKINNRKAVSTQHPNHMAGPSGPGPAGVPGNGLTPSAVPASRPPPGNLGMVGPALHHHHAHPDGNAPGGEDVSGDNNNNHTSQYATSNGGDPSTHRPSSSTANGQDLRPAHVFHDMSSSSSSSYPPPGSASVAASSSHMQQQTGPSMAPLLHHDGNGNPIDHHGNGSSNAVATRTSSSANNANNTILFGDLPEGKRRKFILVEDLQRGCRVRVKVMLDQVDMDEIPDSYRKKNSVFPRCYFPVQMQGGEEDGDEGEDVDGGDGGKRGRRVRRGGRGRLACGAEAGAGGVEGGGDGMDVDVLGGGGGVGVGADGAEGPTVGRTVVPMPGVAGGDDVDVAVPGIGRGKKAREMMLNDLGYRMSWSQSRVFAGRPLFLQRALDAYRNKMRSTMLTAGQEVSTVAPHFETRVGKRKWLERERRMASSSGGRGARGRGRASASASASRRGAADAEGGSVD